MSAYVVSRGHIRYLVEAALHLEPDQFREGSRREGLRSYYHDGKRHEVNSDTADALGLMLWRECEKSVRARYPNDGPSDLPGPVGDGPRFGYVHKMAWNHRFDVVQVIKAIRCYEYQSCEHQEWESSQAKAFCDALLAHAASCLPGYEEAEWGCPASFEINPPTKPSNIVPFQSEDRHHA